MIDRGNYDHSLDKKYREAGMHLTLVDSEVILTNKENKIIWSGSVNTSVGEIQDAAHQSLEMNKAVEIVRV